MTLALIDVGSNTIRLSIYAIGAEAREIRQAVPGEQPDDLGSFVRLFSKKSMAGLAGYVDDDNMLVQDGIDRACESLTYFKSIVDNLRIDETHVFATASLRNVDNSAEALSEICRRTGFDIELISSEEEALLGYSSFKHDCPIDHGVLMDIGGGSSEVVCFASNVPNFVTSIPLGSLKLFKKDVAGLLPTKKERRRICAQVEDECKRLGIDKLGKQEVLCGIGGTARAAAKLMRRLLGKDPLESRFSFSELEQLVEVLAKDDARALELIIRTCPDRIHTVIPGLLVLYTVASSLQAEKMVVSKYGVREGYVCERIVKDERTDGEAA